MLMGKEMGKVITISVPEWVDEKKFKDAFIRALIESSPGKMSVDELRELIGMSETGEEIEVPQKIENIREKDRRRLKWLS